MNNKSENAISPTRAEDYPEWYQEVVKQGEMADSSAVRGCMVIRPWGYGIWESIQRELDRRIKATGHENAYFPLFIPLRFMQEEASHVEGFATECAVVTHHRLEMKDGKLVPAGELEEPLIVRPTSETIIGDSFSKWVQSYRDLPLLINQWANVVRWEMRPRVFLRTAEFLWQEGHTVHANQEQAMEETMRMLEVYRSFAEEVMALPVIAGEKSAGERFPGAVRSFTIEAMMQDRKAIQAGTSHFLGQNFAKASKIKFLTEKGEQEFAHTTSWGVSTRLIGGVIMAHGDDDGLRIPPRLAPKQVVVLPVIPKDELRDQVISAARELALEIGRGSYAGQSITAHVDVRDIRGGEKAWSWIKKGAPIRVELGPRDIESGSVMVYRRDRGPREKEKVSRDQLVQYLERSLAEIQQGYFDAAKAHLDSNMIDRVKNFAELKAIFTPKSPDRPEFHGGFVRAKWGGDAADEERLKELKITIRCIPEQQTGEAGVCVLTGKPTSIDAIFAKAY